MLYLLILTFITGFVFGSRTGTVCAADHSEDRDLKLAREAGFVPDGYWDREEEPIDLGSFSLMLHTVLAGMDESAAKEFEKSVGAAMTSDISLDREIAAICLYYAAASIQLPENTWGYSQNNIPVKGAVPYTGPELNELIGEKCWNEMTHRIYGDLGEGVFPHRFEGGYAWDMYWDDIEVAAYFSLLSRSTEDGMLFFDYDVSDNTMHMDRDVSFFDGIRAVSRFYAMCRMGELFEKQMHDSNKVSVHKKVITDYSAEDLISDIKIGIHFNQAHTDFLSQTVAHEAEMRPDQGYVSVDGSIYEKITDHLTDRYTENTQKEILKAYHESGFNIIRFPVTWTPYMNDTSYEIDEGFLSYVEYYVNMILDEGMYCIIGSQRDYAADGDAAFVDSIWNDRWMEPEFSESVNTRFAELWRQVAEHFRDYDEHLIFEGLNEPMESEFPDGPAYQNQKNRINELNSIFVDTVRSTGGNNTLRMLILNCLWGQFFLETLEPPEDDHIAADYHCYFINNGPLGIYGLPDNVPANDTGAFTEWSRENPTLKAWVEAEMKQIREFTEKTGVPVIIGEAGGSAFLSEDENLDLLTFEIESAKKLNVPIILWDSYCYPDGISRDDMNDLAADFLDGTALYKPDTGTWQTQRILDAVIDIVK